MKARLLLLVLLLASPVFGGERKNLFDGSICIDSISDTALLVSRNGLTEEVKNNDVFVTNKDISLAVDYSETAVLHLSSGMNIFMQDHAHLTFYRGSFLHVVNSTDYLTTVRMSGVAWFKLPREPLDGTSIFVMTDSAEIEVHSAEFYVEAISGFPTIVKCLQGKLVLTSTVDFKTREVSAGQEAAITGYDGEKNVSVRINRLSERYIRDWQEKRTSVGLPSNLKWVLKDGHYVIESI